MTTVEVILPAMGEGITDATITKWLVEEGEMVEEDQPIVEIATDKVDSEIPAPVAGKLKKIFYKDGEIPKVGEILAVIATDSAAGEDEETSPTVDADMQNQEHVSDPVKTESQSSEMSESIKTVVSKTSNEVKENLRDKYISPYIRTLAKANNISIEELSAIQGSGLDGIITKNDILSYMNKRLTISVEQKNLLKGTGIGSLSGSGNGNVSDKDKKNNGSAENARVEIIEMDRMRKLIAENMVRSVHTSPHVTSFVEADLTNLVQWRNKIKAAFLNKYREKLTYTPLIIEAVAKALKDYPLVNVSVEHDKILVKKDINVGMATALTNGNLIVPVIKNADQMTLPGLAAKVNDLAKRARENKLKPAEIKSGTFTITNLGSFGNVSGTPIINQPEVAILAAGAILRKPAVVKTSHGETIGIRDIMILSLTYDHRVVDGSLGGIFLKRVAEYLENYDAEREI